MKHRCLLLLLALSLALSACSRKQLTPVQLATRFAHCQHVNPNQANNCALFETEFNDIGAVLANYPGRHNLGQQIIDTQTQLVTLQQAFAKKTLSEPQIQSALAAIEAKKRKVLVLRSVFLLGVGR